MSKNCRNCIGCDFGVLSDVHEWKTEPFKAKNSFQKFLALSKNQKRVFCEIDFPKLHRKEKI